MEKVIIKNSCGEKLVGMLHNSKNSDKLVIVCHGRVCTKDEHFYHELCTELSKNGFNAFRFDFSGNGKSEGKFKDSTVSKDIQDIKSIVDYFKNIYEISCIIGHSQGAVEVLLFQAKYGLARSVVGISGYSDQRDATMRKYSKDKIRELNKNGSIELKAWGKSFNLYKKYFGDRAKYGDIRSQVRKIKEPILVIHGTEDTDVPFKNGILMKKALKKNDVFISIKGADHFFINEIHRTELIKSIITWLK